MNRLASLFAALILCGCAQTNKDGVRSHLILGFGVVRVSTTNQTVGTVLNVKALGLYTGDRSLNLGWVNRTRVEIATNANVVLEIKK